MTRGSEPADWRWHAGALVLYAGIAWIAIVHGHSLTGEIAGWGSDPYDFIWTLAWWPWAIAHGLNPLYCHLMWQPVGVCLMWVASLPMLSLLGLPLILLSGPVLTYNAWIVAAPVLSAWFAYRLCLRLAKDPVAAIIGGYLFGFSSYEMAQDTAALNLSVTFLVPALLLVILSRLDGEIDRVRTVVLACLILVCQFLIGNEVFTSIFLFGGIAWLLALAYLPARRPALWRLLVDGLATGPFVAILLAPFLVSMFSHYHYLNLPAAWPYYFCADALNFFLPGTQNILYPLVAAAIPHFKGGVAEVDAYLGLPLLAVVALYVRGNGHAGGGRLLAVMFLGLVVLSLGPALWVANRYTGIPLPGLILVHVPVLSLMLPARFALFVSLVAAIMAALWLAEPALAGQKRRRLVLGALACLVLLPRPTPWLQIPNARFFEPGEVRRVLGDQPRIMILPFSIRGPSSYWQVESGFDFIQTGGYVGFPPRAMQHYAAVGELFGGDVDDVVASDVGAFAEATGTQFIVAGPGTQAALLAKIDQLHWPRRAVDDVVVYTVPDGGAGAPRD
jgi:hypothetical protein